MDKAFPDKTEKIKKEADDGNEDYAIGSDVENYDGDDYQDTVSWIIVSGFSIFYKV